MASIDLSLLSVGFGFLDVNAIGEGCTGPIRSFSGMKKNGIVGEKKRKENDFFFFCSCSCPDEEKKIKEKKRKEKNNNNFICLFLFLSRLQLFVLAREGRHLYSFLLVF